MNELHIGNKIGSVVTIGGTVVGIATANPVAVESGRLGMVVFTLATPDDTKGGDAPKEIDVEISSTPMDLGEGGYPW